MFSPTARGRLESPVISSSRRRVPRAPACAILRLEEMPSSVNPGKVHGFSSMLSQRRILRSTLRWLFAVTMRARVRACVRLRVSARSEITRAHSRASRTSIRLRESPDSGSAVILTTWQPLCRPHACKLRMKSVRQRGTEARRKKKRAGSLSSPLPLPLASLSSRGLHISRGRYEREEFHRARSNVARRE